MKFHLIAEEKTHHPVSRLAGALGVSRAGYHSWEKRVPSSRKTADEQLKVRIGEIHAASFGIYGAPASMRSLPTDTGSTSAGSGSPA